MYPPYSSVYMQKTVANVIIRYLHKTTHYDVLKLSPSCTSDDVKEAFINLSKTWHPDKNLGSDSHAHYVKIVEAYNILGKASSRADYDMGLKIQTSTQRATYHDGIHRPWADPSVFNNRDKSKDDFYRNQPYYGVKGTKKVSNAIIARLCIAFLLLGAIGQYFLIRSLYHFEKVHLDKTSNDNGVILNAVRAKAEINGEKEQIELLIHKLNLEKST